MKALELDWKPLALVPLLAISLSAAALFLPRT